MGEGGRGREREGEGGGGKKGVSECVNEGWREVQIKIFSIEHCINCY